MNYSPWARIALRYLSGVSFGGAYVISERVAIDPDVIMIVSAAIGAAVEGIYALAKRNGWAT